jgi:hypothetical protein
MREFKLNYDPESIKKNYIFPFNQNFARSKKKIYENGIS